MTETRCFIPGALYSGIVYETHAGSLISTDVEHYNVIVYEAHAGFLISTDGLWLQGGPARPRWMTAVIHDRTAEGTIDFRNG